MSNNPQSEDGTTRPGGDAGAEINVESELSTNDQMSKHADEVFPEENPIFANKNLLQISYVPDGSRIVGRDKEIKRVAEALAGATRGEEPDNLLIHGRTGTGKSLVAKYVSQLTQYKVKNTPDLDVTIGAAYIDCKTAQSETKFAQVLGKILNEEEETGIEFPDHGLGFDTYIQRAWEVMDELYDVVLVILDEMDKHKHSDSVLSTLSRAGEDQHITQCKLGLVVISNKSQWVKRLEQRTGSGLQVEPMVFSAYDEEQLTEIIEHRRDAFHDGILDDDVIPLVAEYAAKEHGDARRALDILRNAGVRARKTGSDMVTGTHVEEAADYAEYEEANDHIADEPLQSHITLLALAMLAKKQDKLEFSNKQIYQVYNALASEVDDEKVLSLRRIRDILDELDFYEVVRTTEKSGGYQRGSIVVRQPVYSPEIVERIVIENRPRLEEPHKIVEESFYDHLISQ